MFFKVPCIWKIRLNLTRYRIPALSIVYVKWPGNSRFALCFAVVDVDATLSMVVLWPAYCLFHRLGLHSPLFLLRRCPRWTMPQGRQHGVEIYTVRHATHPHLKLFFFVEANDFNLAIQCERSAWLFFCTPNF